MHSIQHGLQQHPCVVVADAKAGPSLVNAAVVNWLCIRAELDLTLTGLLSVFAQARLL